MSKQTIGIIIAVVVILAGVGIYSFARSNNQTSPDEAMRGDVMEIEPVSTEGMTQADSYKDYSPAAVQAEQQDGNKVVLFFHAPWCPFCKAADAAFKASADQIPANVTVLKTDYDSNGELKKQYGVTYQHTFVQIDASGNMVTKWNGGDIDTLTKNLK